MTDLLIIVQLIFLEGILSLDNAAILGAMVAHLPDDRPVPWPEWLCIVGRRLDRLLGPQQTAALRVGLLGAYLGRGLMLVMAAWVVENPWLKLFGALYLLKLAAGALGQPDGADGRSSPGARGGGFWQVVLAIELADLAFSLDNVVAAVTLTDRLPVILVGVALGILMMRFAAGVFAHLVRREPILEPAAYLLVFNIGLELLLEEVAGIHLGDLTRFAISAGTLAIALVYAHWQPLHRVDPVLRVVGRLLWGINEVADRAVQVATALVSVVISGADPWT